MDNTIKQQVQDRLSQAQNVHIIAVEKSGFDGLASALSLYLSIKKLGKNVSINAKAPTVGDARMLYAVDKIGNKQEDKKNLVITIDNAVKNVDKVTYYLEGTQLRIVVHAFPQSDGISTEEITFDRAQVKPDLLFAIGYESPEQLKTDLVREQEIDSSLYTISISNTDSTKKFAQINIHDPQTTCLSELMAIFIQEMALPLNEDIAFNLYSGVATSTQMFSPRLVSQTTFQIAGWLIKFGAGNAQLAQGLFEAQNPTPSSRLGSFEPTAAQINETPIESVEMEKTTEKDWLKPPKIYRGSKSFDIES